MLETKADDSIAAKTNKEAKKIKFEKLLFELAAFEFSLKDIQKSLKGLKDILTDFAETKGCTIMYGDKYDYLWKVGGNTTLPFKVGVGAAGYAAKHKKIIVIKDISKNPIYIRMRDKSYNSIVSVPIQDKSGHVIGVLNFTYENFDPEKIPKKKELEITVEKLVTIIENVILYYQSENQKNELKARRVISTVFENPTLNQKQKLEQTAKETANYLKLDKVKFFICRQNKTGLFAKEHKKIESVVERKYKENPNTSLINLDMKKNNGNFLTAQPIIYRKKLMGFILLEDRSKNTDNLSTLEKSFLRITAARVGIYISQEEASQKIIDEKEKWRLVFHNVEDAILLISRDHTIVEANQRAKEMLGAKNKSLTNENFSNLFKIINQEVKSPLLSFESAQQYGLVSQRDLQRKIDAFFESGKKISPKEYLIETQNGKYWTIVSMNTAIERWNLESYGVLHIRDIGKRKKLEQDKNEFMSMVSHELRTPLSSMRGYLSMTLNDDYGELNERQRNSLRKIEGSTERMVNLVEDLLDVSRIELGKISLMKEPVDVLDVALKCLRDTGHKIQKKKMKVFLQDQCVTQFTRNKGLESKPSCIRAPIYVWGDHDRITQVMQNLIDNAIKYSFDGTEVSVNVKSGKDFVELSVKDQGVGIPKEDYEKLFKKFSRVNNPLSIQAGGTGLGLYITKRLVNAHKGKIAVTSSPKKGSVFLVKIPIAKQLPLI